MIVKQGRQWILYTRDGAKILGRFKSKELAEKREKEIMYFLKNKR